jgi:predicted phosphoribosyltransferase
VAYVDRRDAGRRLAVLLEGLFADSPTAGGTAADSPTAGGMAADPHVVEGSSAGPPVVEGMARGGVPVAFEVARALGSPLDVVVVRKLGHPRQPELGLGAIGEEGVRIVNTDLVRQLDVTERAIDAVAARESAELERRLRAYRGGRPPLPVRGRTVVVVDDGLATGFTARAAIEVMRRRGAARVVLAVPVGPPGAVAALAEVADDVVCAETTEQFFGISEWYEDFAQVGDAEVARLLATAEGLRGPSGEPAT